MGCHTWDPSKSHDHIFAGPTWAATPGAQKDAHMKHSWVPQAHADWDVPLTAHDLNNLGEMVLKQGQSDV